MPKIKAGDLLKIKKCVDLYILDNIDSYNMTWNTYLAFRQDDIFLLCHHYKKHDVKNIFQIFDPAVNKLYNVKIDEQEADVFEKIK